MSDEMKISVTYETPEGEVKTLKTTVPTKPGDKRQELVLDVVRNGFRIQASDRGIFHHIPPGRVLAVTYAE